MTRPVAIGRRRLLAAAGVAALTTARSNAASDDREHVYAAASLAAPLQALFAATPTALIFGASSTLARQIAAGAPASLYISAEPRWIDWLGELGLLAADRVLPLATNRLVLASADPAAPLLEQPPDAAGLRALLGEGRLAMGDPAHVPQGIYGRAALALAGLWEAARPRLAPTEDARATLALLSRREVPLAVVYASDLQALPMLRPVCALPLPPGEAVEYRMAPIGDRASTALAMLRSPAAARVLRAHGLTTAP